MTGEDSTRTRLRRAVRPAYQGGRRALGTWIAALMVFIIAVQTAPEVYDLEQVEGGLLPIVAAGAAVPVGLMLSNPLVGWAISAGTALTFSQVFPLLDQDPWPWPPVHGLATLALLFSVVAQRPRRTLTRSREIVLKLAVWITTAALFGALSTAHAGWIVGVTAVAAAGGIARWIYSEAKPIRPADETRPSRPTLVELRRSFHEAFVGWTKSPPLSKPLGQRRFGDPEWLRWIRAAGPWILAFSMFWITIGDVRDNLEVHALALPVLSATIALPAGLLRERILLGWRLTTVVAVILALIATPAEDALSGHWPVSIQWVWIATIFFVSVRHDRWTTVWVWLASVLVQSAGLSDDAGTATTLIVVTTALVFIGDLLRTRIQTSRSLEEQAELSELERARRAVLEEKARIARDLHDVVAHHMSMVVVQAETAPFRVDDLSEGAKAEFASISTSARSALSEIRGLLGVLRSDTNATAYSPQPGSHEVEELVNSARRSGVDASLSTTGVQRPLTAATELSAYRIIQEALANAARHAPGSEVSVDVGFTEAAVNLSVTNSAPENMPAPGPPGHGISGMRERAAVVGGTVDASPRPDGGFEVVASLPIDHQEEA